MSVNTVRIRVRYPEVDRMNVVHHSHYAVWFEIGRTELMRGLGVPYAKLEAANLFMPVIELGVRYRVSVRYDEEVDLDSFIEDLKGARIRFGYRLKRPSDGRLMADGFTVHAGINEKGTPVRFPPELREALQAAVAPPLEGAS